ncbi:MAG: DUF1501 domain-containing protein [Pirellulales bacterium]
MTTLAFFEPSVISVSLPSHSTRRAWLGRAAQGLGLAALASLDNRLAASPIASPCAVPRVRRVIWLFMHGGPSHVDLFDPKPELKRLQGQPLPDSFGMVMTRRKVAENPLLPSVQPFRPRGQCGMMISDFLPEIAKHADDLCVIRSLHGDSVNHPQSVYQMNTGRILMGHPSLGSWVAYGLGSENEDLPAFIVLPDPGGGLKGGPPAYGSGFLPATYQGIPMRSGSKPILDMEPAHPTPLAVQRRTLDLLQQFNRDHLQLRDEEDALAARVRSYELAFRMQAAAPELVDIAAEPTSMQSLYGLDQPHTAEFGTRCLLARRMIERGVRFVQLYSGNTEGWDAHSDVLKNHTQLCRATDLPIAGLLTDLKQRGLWDDTLVIWGGEFGRMPMSEQGKGRDHNPWGYSMWLAGGAIRGGMTYGGTDEVGLRAVDQPVSIHSFHATLLHLLGIDAEALSFPHNGLDERLIGPAPVPVIKDWLA